jgi:hypothetical protein
MEGTTSAATPQVTGKNTVLAGLGRPTGLAWERTIGPGARPRDCIVSGLSISLPFFVSHGDETTRVKKSCLTFQTSACCLPFQLRTPIVNGAPENLCHSWPSHLSVTRACQSGCLSVTVTGGGDESKPNTQLIGASANVGAPATTQLTKCTPAASRTAAA